MSKKAVFDFRAAFDSMAAKLLKIIVQIFTARWQLINFRNAFVVRLQKFQ